MKFFWKICGHQCGDCEGEERIRGINGNNENTFLKMSITQKGDVIFRIRETNTFKQVLRNRH